MGHNKANQNLDVRQNIAQPSTGSPVRICMLNETKLDLIMQYNFFFGCKNQSIRTN